MAMQEDWGAAAPELVTVLFSGFNAGIAQGDVFFFFTENPVSETVSDEDVEDIVVDESGSGKLILRSHQAAMKAMLCNDQEFDHGVIKLHLEAPPKVDAPAPVRVQPPVSTDVRQQPQASQQSPPNSVRQEPSIRGGGGGGFNDDRRGGNNNDYGGDSYRGDRRDDFQRGGNDRRAGGGGGGSGFGGGFGGSGGAERRGYDGGRGGGGGGGAYDREQRNNFDGRAQGSSGPSDETLGMNNEDLVKASEGRKKLVLKKSAGPKKVSKGGKSSIFGNARPREENIAHKTVNRQTSDAPAPAAASSGTGQSKTSALSPRKGKKNRREAAPQDVAQQEPAKPVKVIDGNRFDVLENDS